MENQANGVQTAYEDLPVDEKILITAPSKLIKHLRAMETARLIDEQTAASLIGCVKKITNIANSRGMELKRLEVRTS